jgi:surfeit locus 1 family protein
MNRVQQGWVQRGEGSMTVANSTAAENAQQRSPILQLVFAVAMIAATAGFLALGIWQIQRLHWKHALISQVTQRVHAAPVPAPSPDQWAQVGAAADAYKHVQLRGHFLDGQSTLVQAVTDLGNGSWLITPLVRDDGTIVLVNRGFVAIAAISARDRQPLNKRSELKATATVTVNGLLRMSEPRGAFLRHNDAAANRWYSRDVEAIAAAHGLHNVAPYFVDADVATNQPAGAPIGGLTVIAFSDNHLVYALTWFVLALMAAGAMLWVMRDDWAVSRFVTLSGKQDFP